MSTFNIKASRVFTPIRKYAWLFTMLVAFGGLWYPKLGLLVILIMLSLIVMGFLKGRYWCGNFCSHGSLYDAILLPLSFNKGFPNSFKSKVTQGLVFIVFISLFSRKMVNAFSHLGSDVFLDKIGMAFVMSYLVVFTVGTLLAIFISPRSWCNFCPMGTMQRITYKLGKALGVNKKTDKKVAISRQEFCHNCGTCARVCPMQLKPYLEFSGKNQFDDDECIRCSTCVVNCPAEVLTLNNEERAVETSVAASMIGYQDRREIASEITDIKELAPDVREYNFKFLNPTKVNWQPGQFILVKIQNNPKMFRAYSISSYDEEGSGLCVTIKKTPGGYGTDIIFDSFKVGDLVTLEGPMGNELVIEEDVDKVIFVAGGIGITPFVPMVEDAVKDGKIKDVKLIYGVNTEKEFVYDGEFSEIAMNNDKFEYLKVVAFDENWQGKKGFVTDVLQEMDLEGYKIYMCGPKPMINAAMKVLDDLNVRNEDIYYESQ